MGEVDGLGLLGQNLDLAARIIVTLLKGLEGGGGLTAEAEGAGHLDPVDLESGAALWGVSEGSGWRYESIGRDRDSRSNIQRPF